MKAAASILVLCALAAPKVQTESPMLVAAQAFLASLSEEQRALALLPRQSPDRTTWTYVPGARKGVAWSDLDDKQRRAGHRLLQAALSEKGYDKIESIRALEPVLAELEGGNTGRDPEKYWFVFFGEPSREKSWLWRYEGHHVSLTFALHKDVVFSSTPQLLWSNPAEVQSGASKGKRVLAREQDLAFQFVESLAPGQRGEAVLSDAAPVDIVTGSSRKAAIEGRLGLSFTKLGPPQKELLRQLILVHTEVQSVAEQKRRMASVEKEDFADIVFAWLGPVRRDARHYYRIQGKGFVIEYDNTQSDGNHIHTVWRDFDGDFGADLLEDHYEHGHRH